MTIKPFDFITDLSSNKKNLIKNAENPALAVKDYSPFLINRGFSYFVDTIMAANEMNRTIDLPNLLQHDFYFYEVRKTKRWYSWPKKVVTEDVEAISKYYNINIDRAKEYLALMNSDQLGHIKRLLNKGGKL